MRYGMPAYEFIDPEWLESRLNLDVNVDSEIYAHCLL